MTHVTQAKVAAAILVSIAITVGMFDMYSVKQNQIAAEQKVEELYKKIDEVGTLSATLDKEILRIVVQLVQHGGLVMKDKDGRVVLEKEVAKSDNSVNGE